MTSDSSRGIASIEYDNLNHPLRAQFTDGSHTEWVYSADGTKLRTVHTTAADGVTVQMGSTLELTPEMVLHHDPTDYRGHWSLRTVISHASYSRAATPR